MKVLIKLDDDVFKDIRESDFDSARAIVRNFQATITDAIRNGTPIPDNATNGDVIKAMFPNEVFKEISEYIEGQQVVSIFGKKSCMCFDVDWWNAQYKGV